MIEILHGIYDGTWMIHGMDYWRDLYVGKCEADTKLIEDAPLILQDLIDARAEIERLLKENYKLKRFVENIEWGLKGVKE